MKKYLSLVFTILIYCQVCAQKRYALVIGNDNYKNRPLKNTIRDAELMASTLNALNFEVNLLKNAKQENVEKSIKSLLKVASDSSYESMMVYYAGHAYEFDGKNYIVPVDSVFDSNFDPRIDFIELQADIIDRVSEITQKPLIMILDACRDNPFKLTRGSGQGIRHFLNSPMGSLIAFSAESGKTAPDGEGKNGLYASILAKNMMIKGATIEDVFKKTKREVNSIDVNQNPVYVTNLSNDYYLIPLPTKTVEDVKQLNVYFDEAFENQFYDKAVLFGDTIEPYLATCSDYSDSISYGKFLIDYAFCLWANSYLSTDTVVKNDYLLAGDVMISKAIKIFKRDLAENSYLKDSLIMKAKSDWIIRKVALQYNDSIFYPELSFPIFYNVSICDQYLVDFIKQDSIFSIHYDTLEEDKRLESLVFHINQIQNLLEKVKYNSCDESDCRYKIYYSKILNKYYHRFVECYGSAIDIIYNKFRKYEDFSQIKDYNSMNDKLFGEYKIIYQKIVSRLAFSETPIPMVDVYETISNIIYLDFDPKAIDFEFAESYIENFTYKQNAESKLYTSGLYRRWFLSMEDSVLLNDSRLLIESSISDATKQKEYLNILIAFLEVSYTTMDIMYNAQFYRRMDEVVSYEILMDELNYVREQTMKYWPQILSSLRLCPDASKRSSLISKYLNLRVDHVFISENGGTNKVLGINYFNDSFRDFYNKGCIDLAELSSENGVGSNTWYGAVVDKAIYDRMRNSTDFEIRRVYELSNLIEKISRIMSADEYNFRSGCVDSSCYFLKMNELFTSYYISLLNSGISIEIDNQLGSFIDQTEIFFNSENVGPHKLYSYHLAKSLYDIILANSKGGHTDFSNNLLLQYSDSLLSHLQKKRNKIGCRFDSDNILSFYILSLALQSGILDSKISDETIILFAKMSDKVDAESIFEYLIVFQKYLNLSLSNNNYKKYENDLLNGYRTLVNNYSRFLKVNNNIDPDAVFGSNSKIRQVLKNNGLTID